MSVKIGGPRVLATAGSLLLNGATQASISCRIRIDAASAALTANARLLGRSDGKGFAITATTSFSMPALRFTLLASTGSAYGPFLNYVPGRSYHLAATWDATNAQQVFYIDGRVATTAALSTAMQAVGGSSLIQLGSASLATGSIFSIADCCFWSGAVLTASDVAAICARTADPSSLYAAALAWRPSLGGVDGATVAAGDSGLVDPIAGLNLSPSGSGSAAWSADSLDYIPAIATTARVLKSGKTIAFFFNDSVTGDPVFTTTPASNPTISINGGDPVALSNPVFTTTNNSLPYAQYALPSLVSASDVVTYSAADAWSTRPTPWLTSWPLMATGPASAAAVVNGVGLTNVPVPAPTMKLGWNLAAPTYWTVNRQTRNLARTTAWSNVTAYDANGKPSALQFGSMSLMLPNAVTANGLDNLKHVATAAVPWMPDNPNQYTVVWSESAPGNDSGGWIATNSNTRAIVTERTDLAENPSNGIRRKRVFEVTRPVNPVDYTLGLGAYFTRTDWTDLYVFGPGNAIDYNDIVDDVLKQYIAGAGVVRFMDQTVTNGSPVATRAQLRPQTDFNNGVNRPQWVTLSQVGPVDDITQFAYSVGWMAAKFTTAAPHGFYSGQFVNFKGCVNLSAGSAAKLVAQDGVTTASIADGYGAPIYVTSPTTFEAMLWHGNTSLGTTTANAWATTQLFDPASQVGFPSTTVGICFEDCFRTASTLGVDAWICVPFAATDDCVAAIAEKARDYLAPGLKVWVEYSNEIWNQSNGFYGQSLGALIQGRKATPQLSITQWGAVRAGQIHDVFAGVMEAAGRGGDMVRVIAFQWGGYSTASTFLNFCAANSIKIDAYAIAPYIDFPTTLAAAVDGYDSDQLHDFWQLLLTYNFPTTSSQSGGIIPTHSAALKATYPNARLVCYEGSIEKLLAGSITDSVRRSHDLTYHPRMYETYRAYLSSLQNSGVSLFTHFQLMHQADWAYNNGGWSIYHWHGQQWGYGDGSDGKANNLNCLATTKPATVQQDFQNVSVAGQAWKDWAAALPDRRLVASPISAPAVLVSLFPLTDHSTAIDSLQGGTALSQASATVNVIWSSPPIASPAAFATPLPSTVSNLQTPALGAAGAVTSAFVVSKFSANPNTFGYFKQAEPPTPIAGRSITANLDYFAASEPLATISQIVGVSLAAPAAPLRSDVGATIAAIVSDRLVVSSALIGDGRTGSATVDASVDAFANPCSGAGFLASVVLGLDQASDTTPIPGDGSLGGTSFVTEFQVDAGLLQAAGALGTSTVLASHPMTLNALEYFRGGEPEFGLAGKNPTTSLDFFRRAEPFATVTASVAMSADSLIGASSLGAIGTLNGAAVALSLDMLIGPSGLGAIGTLNDVAVAISAGTLIGPSGLGAIGTLNDVAVAISAGTLIGPSGLGAIGTLNGAAIALSLDMLIGPSGLGAIGTLNNAASLVDSLIGASSLGAMGTLNDAASLAASLIELSGLGAIGTLNAAALNGAILLGATSNAGSGAFGAATISGYSLAIAPTFPLQGMMNPASLLADIRLQAAGLGIPGSMGIPYVLATNDAPLTIPPLGGAGIFVGGRVSGGRIAKRYVLPRRLRIR